ncbi:MAG: tyrosine--tRNA ligase [Crocinitomicaceae bacterium]|jgi:tyrosyl-tRNA synthetase|nr:tyrosine--tRNA ligase [Crocinitomicaceae bacterium]MDA9881442.1 tyrosine--tRNA ligase [Crocinitomicaceae bacterium]MDG1037277.1 tyrosine--tRNA ligase [Crocinitomicaceae bacterium]MDG1741238.1 tyrosine--tRNA ligase [Crocinitomicaceae bacterium]
MPKNFIEELTWRGMIHDIMPGTEEALNKKMSGGYIGFDPTADSLHIGSLVQIMTLVHFQRAGHKPYALVGGATGMVGDPSGKSQERNLLDTDTLNHNVACVRKQLEQFLDFDAAENAAEMVNNYDWFQGLSFLEFIRDVGKHISVNYMMAKDSVKSRLETGMSFTEFSYQLVQGYDFYYLNKHKNCIVQLGGSDQWGNIVTGTELIRRKGGGEAYAVTTPLIKKADGTKFGKTEGGNVWLDPKKTSPYKFYQYWLNASDVDAENYIKIFTLKNKEEIDALIKEHKEAEYLRKLQKSLAEDITRRVHGEEALSSALNVTNLLFGKGITKQEVEALSALDFEAMKEAIPFATLAKSELDLGIIDALGAKTGFLSSNGEARRELKGNAISVNKEKVTDAFSISEDVLVHDKYVLISKGKKNNFLLVLD